MAARKDAVRRTVAKLAGDLTDSVSVTHGVTTTAAVTALAAVDPRKLTTGKRLGYRAALAGVAALMSHASGRRSGVAYTNPGMNAGIVVGSAGAVFGLAEAAEKLDAKIMNRLERAGVKRPRTWFVALTAVCGLGAWLLERKTQLGQFGGFGIDGAARPGEGLGGEFGDGEHLIPGTSAFPLKNAVREILEKMLSATDDFGAPELRAQLATAKYLRGDDYDPDLSAEDRAEIASSDSPRDDMFASGVMLEVDRSLPLAVPGSANFPIIGRFLALDGRSFDVSLVVHEGLLWSVNVVEGADWNEESVAEWAETGRYVGEISEWPAADEVELLIETKNGWQLI